MIAAVSEATDELPDVETFIVETIARKKQIAPAAVTAASTFAALGIDSLQAADLIFTIEETFHLDMPDEMARSLRTVGQVVSAIQQLIDARAAAR
jgi:acyl carrier protein